jgi:hypothetical protein
MEGIPLKFKREVKGREEMKENNNFREEETQTGKSFPSSGEMRLFFA